MRRRDFTSSLAGLCGLGLVGNGTAALAAPNSTRFDPDTVPALARQLAASPYRPPATTQQAAHDLTYDQYRSLRFRPERAVWRAEGLPYRMEYFPQGYLFHDPVEVYEVSNGQATPAPFSNDMFTSDTPGLIGLIPPGGPTGFRLHAPFNRPDYFDEVAVFLGASYFRSLGRGQIYGLSARGLALDTDRGYGREEFPAFRAFWIETPKPGAQSITVHALLDGPSIAGAYNFIITPGSDTRFEVTAKLYPRRALDGMGVAPQTSMFLFGPSDRKGADDYRNAVHDSEGLQMITGRGEQLWRPLSNPDRLAFSYFADQSPRGFGLMQRNRSFSAFQDAEAHYQRRPSLWTEPLDDWGKGSVVLMEIPSDSEAVDNIAAFWRPAEPWAPGKETTLRYRLHWTGADPGPLGLSKVIRTGVGAQSDGRRQFTIDFKGASLQSGDDPKIELHVSAGTVSEPTLTRLENTIRRIGFTISPSLPGKSELRLRLTRAGAPISETWLYRC